MAWQIFYHFFFATRETFFHCSKLSNPFLLSSPVEPVDGNTEQRQTLKPQKILGRAASLRLCSDSSITDVMLSHKRLPWRGERKLGRKSEREINRQRQREGEKERQGLSWTPLRRGCGLDDYAATDDVSGGSLPLRENTNTMLTYSLTLFCRKGKAGLLNHT